MPQPNPNGTATQRTRPPNKRRPQPQRRRLRPMPNDPPGTSIVGWVTGPDSPNQTIQRFAITGTDLGIMWDNGDPANHQVLMAFGDTNGYCGIPGKQWRYNALFRSQDGALSKTVAVPDGVVGNHYSGSPVWRPGISKQIINSIGLGAGGDGHHPDRRRRRREEPVPQLHVDQELGQPRLVVDELLGDRGVARQRRDLGRLPRAPSARPPAGNENFQMGAFLKPGPGDPYIYSFGTPNGRGGSAFVARVPPNLIPDLTKYEYWNADNHPGSPPIQRPRRR